jgi:maltose-binding protein MalE
VGDLDETFRPAVSIDDEVYGAPFGAASGGGILHNKKVYERLGLEVPETWDEFMANNAKIKEAGIDPVIQSYGDTWTSPLFVLADYHNAAAQDPEWDQKYTSNEVKYAQESATRPADGCGARSADRRLPDHELGLQHDAPVHVLGIAGRLLEQQIGRRSAHQPSR